MKTAKLIARGGLWKKKFIGNETIVGFIRDNFLEFQKQSLDKFDRDKLKGYAMIVDGQNSHKYTDDSCGICCETYSVGDRVIELPGCEHLWHWKCCLNWVGPNGTCAKCRSGVKGAMLEDFYGESFRPPAIFFSAVSGMIEQRLLDLQD